MIEPFHAQLPVRIRFGPGVVSALAEVIDGRRALVVSEPPVLAIDAVAAAVAGLPLTRSRRASRPLRSSRTPPHGLRPSGRRCW